MTYAESATLTIDPNFRGRVQVAVVKYADSIVLEPGNTAAHVSRLKWANIAFQNPTMIATQLQPWVVMDPGIQAAQKPDASDIDDATVQAATEVAIQKYQI